MYEVVGTFDVIELVSVANEGKAPVRGCSCRDLHDDVANNMAAPLLVWLVFVEVVLLVELVAELFLFVLA